MSRRPEDSLTKDALKTTIVRIDGEKNKAECKLCQEEYAAVEKGYMRAGAVFK